MDMERSRKICNEIIERNLHISWSVRTRVDKINFELVSLMKKAGCTRINLGVESGTEKGLKKISKEITLKQVEDAFKILKFCGMESLAYFMFGLPEETKDDMMETISFSRKIKPSFCHFTVFTPFPETKVWRDLIEKGDNSIANAWKNYALNPFDKFSAPTCNEYLNKDQLFSVCNYAYKKFYFNPLYVMKELKSIQSVSEIKRKIKAGLKVLKA